MQAAAPAAGVVALFRFQPLLYARAHQTLMGLDAHAPCPTFISCHVATRPCVGPVLPHTGANTVWCCAPAQDCMVLQYICT